MGTGNWGFWTGLGIGIRSGDWDSGLELRTGNRDWGLSIRIGDLRLGMEIEDWG